MSKSLYKLLEAGPLDPKGSSYNLLVELGFDYCGVRIVNPLWSPNGLWKVDPISAYGRDFLQSGIAAMLGYSLPHIIPAKRDILSSEQRRRHEQDLMKKILQSKTIETHPAG
jgi:hypothetical protein